MKRKLENFKYQLVQFPAFPSLPEIECHSEMSLFQDNGYIKDKYGGKGLVLQCPMQEREREREGRHPAGSMMQNVKEV